MVFRVDKLLYVVECKCTAIQLSQTTRFVSWGSRFEKVFDVHNKKINNLAHIVKIGAISHPLFKDLIEYIPIIIQTEGIYHGTFGFDTDKFRLLLANIDKHYEDGDLMKDFI